MAFVKASYRWIEGMEHLLADLRSKGAEMHTMSNYPVWYRLIDEKLQISRYLEWTFVSCLTGFRKPSAEAYLAVAKAVQRHPSECLLIDDCPENCAGAEEAGMQALPFRGTDDLRRQLSRRYFLRR